MSKQLLVETFTVNLKESKITKLENGAVRVERAKAQHCNIKNKNGRRYPSDWTYGKHLKEDADFNKRIRRNEVFGHIEHPENGRASLREAALIVEKAWMEGDEVFITYRTTTNTLGKELTALTNDGLNYGLSSRATGSVKKAEDGVDEVQEDFDPETWDAVADPSTPGARLVRERIEEAYRKMLLEHEGKEHECKCGADCKGQGKCLSEDQKKDSNPLVEAAPSEGGFKLNVANKPLKDARAYAEDIFLGTGKSLDQIIPDFDKNYTNLQKATKKALDVPRIDMPVIEPTDMEGFDLNLKKGTIDIFKPYAKGQLVAPQDMTKEEGEEWITLGVKDGNPNDDVIKGVWKEIPAKDLLPTQSQIWLEKLVSNIAKWGVPQAGSPITKATLIVSKEGYILDGHHRYGQAMLANPDLKLKALYIPLDIKTLLKIGRSYGAAIGNRPKESLDEAPTVDSDSPLTEDARRLHDEMKNYLRKEFRGMVDDEASFDFDSEAAIYWYAADNHGGQGSDLYGVLSLSKFRPGPSHSGVADEGDMAEMMYDSLDDWAQKKGVVESDETETIQEQGERRTVQNLPPDLGYIEDDYPIDMWDNNVQWDIDLGVITMEFDEKEFAEAIEYAVKHRSSFAKVTLKYFPSKQKYVLSIDGDKRWQESIQEAWGTKTTVDPKEKGKYADKSAEELRKEYKALKAKGPFKRDSREAGRMKELAFAIRAKTGWGKVESRLQESVEDFDQAFDAVKELNLGVSQKDAPSEDFQDDYEMFKDTLRDLYGDMMGMSRNFRKGTSQYAGGFSIPIRSLQQWQQSFRRMSQRASDPSFAAIAKGGLEAVIKLEQDVRDVGESRDLAEMRKITYQRIKPVEIPVIKANLKAKLFNKKGYRTGDSVTFNGEPWIIYDADAANVPPGFTLVLVDPDITQFARFVPTSELEESLNETIPGAKVIKRRGGWTLWMDREGKLVLEDPTEWFTDYPVRYPDGRVVYDRPEDIPQIVKDMVQSYYDERNESVALSKVQIDEATTKLVDGMKERIRELEAVIQERDEKIHILEELNEAMDDLKRRESLTVRLDLLLEKYPQLIKAQHILNNAKTVEQLDKIADECLALMREERKIQDSTEMKKVEKDDKVIGVQSAVDSGVKSFTESENNSLSRLAEEYRRKNKPLNKE